MSQLIECLIVDKKQLTSDSYSFTIEPKESISSWLNYKAGQYITIEVNISGETLRRSYSLSSAAFEEKLTISIKRVKGGKVSNFMIDHIQEGNTISSLKPEGRFVLQTDPSLFRDHYFIAAGSGITPIMSMIKSLLEEEPKSTAYLLYGNKSKDSTMFSSELKELEAKYDGQLTVVNTYTEPELEKANGLGGFLGKRISKWKGMKGRIDKTKIESFLEDNPTKGKSAEFYICGPGNFIESTVDVLKEKKYTNIHKEYFTTPDSNTNVESIIDGKATIKVILNGEEISLEHDNEQTILESIINAGYDPPYSCSSGSCSTCVAKVTEGKVEMEICYALDDDEIEKGLILTCQSKCQSSKVAISFDDLAI